MQRFLVRLTGATATVMALAAASAAASPYVALGDSYSSGVGTRTYYSDGTSCNRSPYAYAPQLSSHYSITLSFQACSGAKTTDVNANQLGTLGSDTKLVTITIGGNDAGFSTVITDCAAYYFNCQSGIDNANAFIRNQLPALLNTTYGKIKAKIPSTARVEVLGYPHLFTSDGQTCNFNALTSSHEQELNQTADLLDSTISGRASAYGFHYVDPRAAFAPHEVCASVEWLNGQSNPLSESYHPNVSGYKEFTTLLEANIGTTP